MRHLFALLAACLLSTLIAAHVTATPVNYTRLNASSSTPTSYITDLDIQQGTTQTITQLSNETNVGDLPAAIAADHNGTTCKYSYTRTKLFTLYSTCTQVRCLFGDGSPQQQAKACVADAYPNSSQHNTLTLTSGASSITFTVDAHTVSY
jgi:hypothetical protein